MPITVTCDECSESHRVKDDALGKCFKCKGCGKSLKVEAATPWDDGSAKRPNSSGQDRSRNESIWSVCWVILLIALIATLFAWVLDRAGPLLWSIRLGGPLIVLLAIGLMRNFRFRTVGAHGDPRGKLRKPGTVIVVAKPHSTTDRLLDDAGPVPESIPSSVLTRQRGFIHGTGIGVGVLGLVLLTVIAPILISGGIRIMVTQTAVTHAKNSSTPIHITGAMAVLWGAALATVGCFGLIPSLLLVLVLWRKHTAKKARQLDERNL